MVELSPQILASEEKATATIAFIRLARWQVQVIEVGVVCAVSCTRDVH